jgi:hypothetical protein
MVLIMVSGDEFMQKTAYKKSLDTTYIVTVQVPMYCTLGGGCESIDKHVLKFRLQEATSY